MSPAAPITLYRASDDGLIVGSASFAETLETARVYRDNPGFGGGLLWRAEVVPEGVLDLTTDEDPTTALAGMLGVRHPGAIGADEWVPRVSDQIAAAGYRWVRVVESYPEDTVTWIWVGDSCDEPDLEEIED